MQGDFIPVVSENEFLAFFDLAIHSIREKIPFWRQGSRVEKINLVNEIKTKRGINPETHGCFLIKIKALRVGVLWVQLVNFSGSKRFFDGKEQGWVNYIEIIPDFRRKGLAKEAMQFAEDWVKSKGLSLIGLTTYQHLEAAVGLYNSLGYQERPIGLLPKAIPMIYFAKDLDT